MKNISPTSNLDSIGKSYFGQMKNISPTSNLDSIGKSYFGQMKNISPTSNLDSIGKSKDKPRKFNTNNCLSELYTEKHNHIELFLVCLISCIMSMVNN